MITKVTDNLYRGARLQESDIKQLRKLNIWHIVNLEKENKDSIYDDKHLCKIINAQFQNFPMSEFKRPKVELLEEIVSFLKRFEIPVYVHCKHGCDRTGYVIAAYRMIVEKWTFGEAWYELIQMGHKWLFYFWWKKSLKEIAKKYGGAK